MPSLTFSDIKIEKLLSLPDNPVANRFYLVETGGTTKLYLSDSKSNLHLLNTGFVAEKNVNKTDDYSIDTIENRTVFNDAGATKSITFYLPCIVDEQEFSFSVLESTVRVATTCAEQLYLGDVLIDTNEIIESSYPGSFVIFRAIEGKWVARYVTGQWDVLVINFVDGGDASSELVQIIDGGNSLSEHTNSVDGGGA